MNNQTNSPTTRVRIEEGTLVLLSGLPGSGKSHLLAHRALNAQMATWLSADELRDAITPAMRSLVDGRVRLRRNESANDAVFAILRLRVEAGLSMGRTVLVDATTLTDAERADWISLADKTGAPHLVVILDTPLPLCIERAAAREVHVPEDVIRTMNQPPLPVVPPEVAARTRRPGAVVGVTAPQGFQRTSRFNHVVMDSDAVLEFTERRLPAGRWDVVGDTHGLLPELEQLLGKAGWPILEGRLTAHPEGRRILFLGDLVDRGLHSIELVRFVKRAVDDGLALCIKGNHEDKLVRFVRTATSVGIEQWSSYANAETGMRMLQLDEAECAELTTFLHRLPPYFVDVESGTAFVHGDVHNFEPGTSIAKDLVFGMSPRGRRVDSDALYQQGVDAGLNRYTVIRGHIPATSSQSHIYSLERHPFQKGELVLLRLDQVRDVFSDPHSTADDRMAAFSSALITHRCEFDFDEYSRKYDLLKGLEKLVESRLVTRQLDASKLFRVFKYSKQTFWNNAWSTSKWLLKARGIVLDAGGNIVSHPFDKVFNYLENGTGAHLPDATPVVVVDKLNGFLGIISAHPLKRGELLVHTQGGFGGDFVQYIQDFLDGSTKGRILKFLARNNVTLMFEVLHKADPHIIEYGDDMMGLHLIGVRGKGQADQAWQESAVDEAAAEMGLRRPAWRRTSFGELRGQIRDARTEGWMVRADTPAQDFLMKIKTPYYLSTKFLGRLSKARTKHLFGNPADFKKTVDEEFYVVVDSLVSRYTQDEFLNLTDDERVAEVRQLINRLQ
jgi:predicted kinase